MMENMKSVLTCSNGLKNTGRACILTMALFLTGCSLLHTSYQTPEIQMPEEWEHQMQTQAPSMLESNDRWWEQFGDARLNGLIDLAFEHNNNLAVAALKVQQAQLRAGLAQSDLWPNVSVNVSGSGRRSIEHSESWAKSSGISGNVSYELDLWGRLTSLRNAAEWEATATQADRESAALALAKTVSDLYWRLAYVNQRIASAQESITYAQKTLDLAQAQYDAGAVSSLEPTQSRQNVLTQKSNLSELIQQRVEICNALAIIFDMPPGEDSLASILPEEPQTLSHDGLPPVYEGIPAEVLARRPDLRAAEWRLRASLADVDAVRTSYYPKISLTGGLGTSSGSLGNLLNNPIATLGAGIALPFIQFNEMRMNTKISQLQYEQAVLNFKQTLYQALSDVEDTLSARDQLNLQYILLQQALADSRKTEAIYEERYRAGKVGLKDWLDAQESRRKAEIALSANQLQRLQNQVLLYQALGGSIEKAENASH